MPYENLQDGLYLISQTSAAKGVRHYGILDVGNRMRHPEVVYPHPVVVHQKPPKIVMDWLQNTDKGWKIEGKIADESDALTRMREALKNPTYDLFGHNCEHFARYVANGKKESHQVQLGVVVASLVALSFMN